MKASLSGPGREASRLADESAASGKHAVEPSPFSCPDQNRAKKNKALLMLAVMVAISLAHFVYRHIDHVISRAPTSLQAQYAPSEDSSLHAAQ
jgi:hypothetical protein